MDLKDRKYIKNTKQLPKFANANTDSSNPGWWKTFKSRWEDGAGEKMLGGITSLADTAGKINSMGTPSYTTNDFMGKYGMNSDNSIDGISYNQYNPIDTGAEESRMSAERNNKIFQGASLGATTGMGLGMGTGMLLGAKLGGLGGPIGLGIGLLGGALFGGLFGNSAKNEEEARMRIALRRQNNYNEEQRTDALTTAILQRQLKRFGDTSTQSLFGAARGSEGVNPTTNETYRDFLVHTAGGKKRAKQNAWVDYGEILLDGDKEHVVTGNPNKKDGERARLGKNTKIISNNEEMLFPGTNMTFAEVYPYAKAGGWVDEELAIQKAVREDNDMKKGLIAAKDGYEGLPHYNIGYENFLANGTGLIQSLIDLDTAKRDDVHNINYRPFNKYEGVVANLMGSRRPNAYPIIQDALNLEAKQRRAINASGGLGVGQRAVANIANSAATRYNRANMLANMQNVYNQYKKEEADALGGIGASLMGANLDAFKFNTNYNAAAHNAKTQEMYMSKRNALDYLTNFFKDSWKMKEYDRNYKLYASESKRKDAETQAYIDALKNNGGSTTIPTSNFYDWYNNLTPAERRYYLSIGNG